MALIFSFNKNNNKSDTQLLQTFKDNGDVEVLGLLYERYMLLVYGVCLKYFGNRELAKDAVMDIYEKLSIEITKHNIHNFKSWLHVVARNHCLMAIRKNNSSINISAIVELDSEFMDLPYELHPIDEEQNIDLSKKLQKCIEKLKNEQEQCIKLFYYENMCYQDISNKLNLDEKKVKSHIQNGKRNLKICLEK